MPTYQYVQDPSPQESLFAEKVTRFHCPNFIGDLLTLHKLRHFHLHTRNDRSNYLSHNDSLTSPLTIMKKVFPFSPSLIM